MDNRTIIVIKDFLYFCKNISKLLLLLEQRYYRYYIMFRQYITNTLHVTDKDHVIAYFFLAQKV